MFCRRNLYNRGNKGVSTLEYALLAMAIVVGLLAAQTSLRRAVSFKWRDAADAFGNGRQLETSGSGATVIVHQEF